MKKRVWIASIIIVSIITVTLFVFLSNRQEDSNEKTKVSSSSQVKKTSESTFEKEETSSSDSEQSSSEVILDSNNTTDGQPITDDLITTARNQLIEAGYPAYNYSDGDMKQLISRASAAGQSITQYAEENLPKN